MSLSTMLFKSSSPHCQVYQDLVQARLQCNRFCVTLEELRDLFHDFLDTLLLLYWAPVPLQSSCAGRWTDPNLTPYGLLTETNSINYSNIKWIQMANPQHWKFCRALCWINRGNLLLPRPGFPLYQVLCQGLSSWSWQWTPCAVHQVVHQLVRVETHWSLELGHLLLGRRRDLHQALLQSHALWQAARTVPQIFRKLCKNYQAARSCLRCCRWLPWSWSALLRLVAGQGLAMQYWGYCQASWSSLSWSLFDSARNHGPEPGHRFIEYQ